MYVCLRLCMECNFCLIICFHVCMHVCLHAYLFLPLYACCITWSYSYVYVCMDVSKSFLVALVTFRLFSKTPFKILYLVKNDNDMIKRGKLFVKARRQMKILQLDHHIQMSHCFGCPDFLATSYTMAI